jgi:hypothetical protein
VVLAADAIMLGWLSTQNPNVVQAVFESHVSAASRLTSVLVTRIVVGLVVSLAFGLVVICPRAGASEGSTLDYFGTIARRREPKFVSAYMHQLRVEVRRLIHVHLPAPGAWPGRRVMAPTPFQHLSGNREKTVVTHGGSSS